MVKEVYNGFYDRKYDFNELHLKVQETKKEMRYKIIDLILEYINENNVSSDEFVILHNDDFNKLINKIQNIQ